MIIINLHSNKIVARSIVLIAIAFSHSIKKYANKLRRDWKSLDTDCYKDCLQRRILLTPTEKGCNEASAGRLYKRHYVYISMQGR